MGFHSWELLSVEGGRVMDPSDQDRDAKGRIIDLVHAQLTPRQTEVAALALLKSWRTVERPEGRDFVLCAGFKLLTLKQRRLIANELLRSKHAFEDPTHEAHENWYPMWCRAVEYWNHLVEIHTTQETKT